MSSHSEKVLDSLLFLDEAFEYSPYKDTIKYLLLMVSPTSTYKDFLDFIHEIMDISLMRMQENSMHYQSNTEPALTEILIKDFVAFNGAISARAEGSQNGHCDICIEAPLKKWQWLGEAKIHGNYDYLQKGLDQLVKRYSIGDENHDHGGMIIFIFNTDASSVITSWRDAVVLREDSPSIIDCTTRPALSFITKHPAHRTSGLPYYVKHIGIMLHYQPHDDANKGINSKKVDSTVKNTVEDKNIASCAIDVNQAVESAIPVIG